MTSTAPAPLLPLPARRISATLRGFAAPVPPSRPERVTALARRVDAALAVTATLLVVMSRLGRYVGPDANGDRPCVDTSGADAETLARWANAGADVLAGVAT